MNKFISIEDQKRNDAIASLVAKENEIIKAAMAKHFGNEDFEENIKKCTASADCKSGVRKLMHGDAVLCELYPFSSAPDGDYRTKFSFNYRMAD